MGLLTSHGLTHHLLRAGAARLRRCLSSSSSYSITMAATAIKMLKWASCWLNSRLFSIVTTAGMTGESKVADFYTRAHIWRVSWRSPNSDCQITRGQSTGNRPISRHRPEIDGIPSGHRQESRQWPADRAPEKWPFGAYSGRWPYSHPPVIGRWSLTQLSEWFKVIKIRQRATNVEIWKSGKNPTATAGI